jgi:hypothetical protein
MLQVLVRFQWVMEVMRGQSTHMEVSLEGLATSVMGGLQDELFNLTLDNLQVSSLPNLCWLCSSFRISTHACLSGLNGLLNCLSNFIYLIEKPTSLCPSW